MRRKEEYPLEKVTLNLREGDFEHLRHLHGRLGAGKVIRQLVIDHLKRVSGVIDQKDHLSVSILPEPEDIL